METPLVINDFLARAEVAYGDRVAVIDEADQPAPSLGDLTWTEFAERSRGHAAWLDYLGVPVGGRVAIISQNSARMLLSFFGICGSGRVLVPINFRLVEEEIAYIVEHSGAEVLLVDPELVDHVTGIGHPRVVVLGDDDDLVSGLGRTPEPWLGPDILAVLRELPGRGFAGVVICPIGFVADHLEVLFDVDIEAAAVAKEVGLTLVRTTSLNDDPAFLEILARRVAEAAR